MTSLTRREFIQAGSLAGATLAMPSLIPARVLGQAAPSRIIQIGVIGCGRIASSMEIPGILRVPDQARIVALCDLDSKRLAVAQQKVDAAYAKGSAPAAPVKTFACYRDMLRDGNVDAVMICVPDHWHALCAVECALAGKDIWLQKPFSQTIHEGRILAEVVRRKGVILQVGSQQRSSAQFRTGCELVRNGRIGRITRVEVGFGKDKDGGRKEEMPVPENLDYDTWLGPTPLAYYTEDRVHNQDTSKIGSRPGWIQMEPYGWGMITNWGAHHLDIVQWGLGMEDRGPLAVSGTCEWMDKGLWNAHREFDLLYTYPGDIKVSVCYRYPNGVRFIGDARQRIAEDHLRILRYYRFQTRFGAALDETAEDACADLAHTLKGLSRERIAAELLNLLALPDPHATIARMRQQYLDWCDALAWLATSLRAARILDRVTITAVLPDPEPWVTAEQCRRAG